MDLEDLAGSSSLDPTREQNMLRLASPAEAPRQLIQLLVILALLAQVAIAVTSLEVHGADFVNPKTGNRFQIVGVAYQPGGSSAYNPGSDPLSDGSTCLRDAALMQRLGINTIRVYNLDPNIIHDECASIFNAVGIYMLLDVNSPLPNESLDRVSPWNSYNVAYLNRTFAVVEAFKNYPNTLLFFAGNEVISDASSGGIVPPYVRAVTRDLKNYVSKHSARQIPIGYSAADVRSILVDTWNYFQCSTSGDSKDPSRIDSFALNSYSWCSGDDIHTSTYDVLASDFANTSLPVFFSEYGCNRVSPRTFDEVQALYGPVMTPSLSGGVVYEYSQSINNYGLVVLNSNGSAQLRPDFDNLQSQYNKLNFTMLEDTPAKDSGVLPVCNASLITNAGFSTNFTIPQPPPGAQAVIDNGLTNPNTGKLISITNLQVSQTVQQSNGVVISGLSIKPLPDDQSNSPSGVNDSSTPSTTTSAAPSATTSNAAIGVAALNTGSLFAGLLAAILYL